jgi:hypothetical protein
MTTFLSLAFTALTSPASGAAAESNPAIKERITVDLRYTHRQLEVAYPVSCNVNDTCTLSSLPHAAQQWRIEVTPRHLPNGMLSISTVIIENGKEVTRSESRTKAGEESRLVSSDEKDRIELVIRAY